LGQRPFARRVRRAGEEVVAVADVQNMPDDAALMSPLSPLSNSDVAMWVWLLCSCELSKPRSGARAWDPSHSLPGLSVFGLF
jgi:hypothetical protein